VLRSIWTAEGDYTSFSGRFYSFQDIAVAPRPAQACPTILIGGHSPSALRRAGRLGDGWLASNASAEAISRGIDEIKKIAAESGRAAAALTFVAAITGASDRRGQLVAPRINPQRRGMTGAPPDDGPPGLIETLSPLAMCDQVIVQPDAPAGEAIELLRRIAEEVMPALA
jgi:alkanesulfonate monooxygenase SsuD/methylene tetrahydromethanopterin reductase-like flavin-dependent oxidoreductase (luciferase family)